MGLGTSLADKITQAQAYLSKGDLTDGCSTLGVFIHEVRAQADKPISRATAKTLIGDAQHIQSVLGF